jgi:heme-degrading monooxygenase HmoA
MTIVTVFRSRLREGVESEYEQVARTMSDMVVTMEGFIDQRFYRAEDGERVTIVRFRDAASQRRWAEHPDHRGAQRRGREEFYSWYDISVSEQITEHHFGTEQAT